MARAGTAQELTDDDVSDYFGHTMASDETMRLGCTGCFDDIELSYFNALYGLRSKDMERTNYFVVNEGKPYLAISMRWLLTLDSPDICCKLVEQLCLQQPPRALPKMQFQCHPAMHDSWASFCAFRFLPQESGISSHLISLVIAACGQVPPGCVRTARQGWTTSMRDPKGLCSPACAEK